MNRKERISRVNTDRMAFWVSLARSSACTTSQEHLKSSMSVPICHIRKEDRMVQIEGPQTKIDVSHESGLYQIVIHWSLSIPGTWQIYSSWLPVTSLPFFICIVTLDYFAEIRHNSKYWNTKALLVWTKMVPSLAHIESHMNTESHSEREKERERRESTNLANEFRITKTVQEIIL